MRCINKAKDPYRLDGCDYQYEEQQRTRKKKEISI